MVDPDKTDPNWRTRLTEGTAKADPWADRILRALQRGMNWLIDRAVSSGASPWIIVGVLIALVVVAFRVVR